MQAQIEQRFQERKLLDHEVDTTSIESMFEIYNTVGGLGAASMQGEILNDFDMLEEIVGDLSYDSLGMIQTQNPNIFVFIIVKIFNYLGYLAKIPITDEDGNTAELNLYLKALDTLKEKNTGPDGEVPAWLEKVEMIFHYGAKLYKFLDSIG